MTKLILSVLAVVVLMMGARAQDPVSVELYYESYCPYSRDFISTQLAPTFAAVPEIMVVPNIVPYGNANMITVGNTTTFVCQHGPDECVGNIIQSCEIHYYPNSADNIPFLGCVAGSSDPNNSSQQCAIDNGQDWDTISACANGDEGSSLEYDNGVKTESLNPPLTSVPWIYINGVHSNVLNDMAQNDLLSLVCNTYQGTRPAACPAQ